MGAKRERGPGARRRLRRAALALGLLFGCGLGPADAARLMSAGGAEPQGYGRITLTFDAPVVVTARISSGVLVLSYGERSEGGSERLALEMPTYVTAVRRDPDGSGLRIALQRTVRVNVQAAGERVFVDLLPENWSGLVPPLPSEVVSELARRARAAETALKVRNPAPPPRTLAVEMAQLPTLTRLSVRLPGDTQATVAPEGIGSVRLRMPGTFRFDTAEIRGRLRPDVARIALATDEGTTSLVVTAADGYVVTTDRDEDGISFDVVRKDAPKPAPPPAPKDQEPAPAAAVASAASPAAGRPSPARPAAREVPERQAGDGLVFRFGKRPPAALFERAGIATLVFETGEPIATPAARKDGLRVLGEPARVGKVALVRFAVSPGTLIDLLPVGPDSWELASGDGVTPSDTVAAMRLPEASGRSRVAVALPQPGSATWLDLDGERIAVVTSAAVKPAGIAKRQRFVDFELLASRNGLAVLAAADDLTVRPDLDGVAIGREGGLAMSAVARAPEVPLGEAGALAVQREPWDRARLGDVRETVRAQLGAAAVAPASARGPLRFALARTLLANGLASEALTVLETAMADDPLLAANRDTAIFRGIALAGMARNDETVKALGGDRLLRDPEAALWRAVAEAQASRWQAAETGFRQTLDVTNTYPADLQAMIRTLAAESAMENGDIEAATARLASAAGPEQSPLIRDRLTLLQARLAEATDRTKVALELYDRLAEMGERPVAVTAAWRGTLLAQAAGKVTQADAIERLERLAITWHGGETEAAITAGLARLYVASGRWRDAFLKVRHANAFAPNATETRVLHEEAQALFDDLFLTPRGDAMGGIEAVALYFDFKELAPIGRRGDAIVRRLADRLVGLDLLESAADLLQYQIDHRLTGPARASVATQLATIRLMDGKPLQALETIEASSLPELPQELRRARALMRARALSDLSRTDLALESIEGEAGVDAARLRADILWTGRRWREAGEAHEMVLGDAWRSGKGLDDAARADVIRAAIAYDLAVEPMGLERLKAKFSGAMAETADARTFALLTAADATRNPAFREIAQKATRSETLAAFLAAYRKRYPDASVPERGTIRPEISAAAQRPDGQTTPPG